MPTREVHLVRWQIVVAFVVLTAAFTFSIWKVQHDSASIIQLQRTNCSLRQFLMTARQARLTAADHETGRRRDTDIEAARGYADLADRFGPGAVGHCPANR